MIVLKISKEGYVRTYHPRVVIPNMNKTIRIEDNWKSKAIHNILQSYVAVYNRESVYSNMPEIGVYDISEDDLELIKEILNRTWGFARDIANNIAENNRFKSSANGMEPEDIIIGEKHYRRTYYHPFQHTVGTCTWDNDAVTKQLRRIYSFVVNMPSPLSFSVYRPKIDNFEDVLEEISNGSWQFSKRVCNNGLEEAREWRNVIQKRKKRKRNKREKLRKEIEQNDPIVHWGTLRYDIYYSGMKVFHVYAPTGRYLEPSGEYYGMKVIDLRYSVVEELGNFTWSEKETALENLQGSEEALAKGIITGDNLKAMIAL